MVAYKRDHIVSRTDMKRYERELLISTKMVTCTLKKEMSLSKVDCKKL